MPHILKPIRNFCGNRLEIKTRKMKRSRASDSPRYFVCFLTRRHRRATVGQSKASARKIDDFSNGNQWFLPKNVSKSMENHEKSCKNHVFFWKSWFCGFRHSKCFRTFSITEQIFWSSRVWNPESIRNFLHGALCVTKDMHAPARKSLPQRLYVGQFSTKIMIFWGKSWFFWIFGTQNVFGPFLSQSKSSEVHVCEIPSRFEIFVMVH